ncbi:MAG: efflux RND transporter periplasmic adaptor subunit [Pseudomonadota bacterium]
MAPEDSTNSPEALTPVPSQPAPSTPTDTDLSSGLVDPHAASSDQTRRRITALVAAVLLAAVVVTAAMWAHFRTTHIVTRNALVRAHLSQLGVRGEGVIAEMLVEDGDRVKKGQLLARLDDRHLQARRAAAEAAIATLDERLRLSRAELVFERQEADAERARAVSRHQQRQAEAEAARLQADDAKAFHAARKSLESNGAIPTETIRDAAAKAAAASSLAEAATASASGALAELQQAELAMDAVALLEARLRVLEAERREAETALEQVLADIESTRVYAPAEGAVIRRLAQPGMAVATGTPVLSLWLSESAWIEAWVPEEALSDFGQGSAVQVSFPALPGERFAGRITRIGLATDFEMPLDYLPQTRESRMRPTPQIGVAVRLDSPPRLARPGLSAVVDIRRGGD